MKTVILAGGMGTRLAEQTTIRPKPMVEIGGRPILWHIMGIYARSHFKEFIVALGYKGEVIKDYFLDHYHRRNDISVDLQTGKVNVHDAEGEDWVVHLLDTGQSTESGGRLKALAKWIGNETFMMTYGDGVADIDIDQLVQFHKSHGRLATVTAVRPPAQLGNLVFDGDRVDSFTEKPQIGEGWINGGFFVLEPEVLSYIDDKHTKFEQDPVMRLAAEGELMAYRHEGFWQCMDTIRDVNLLNSLIEVGQAPWLTAPQAFLPSPA